MGDLMLEVGGRRFDGAADGNAWIARDGLDGWWDSAETTFEEELVESGDGAFDPAEIVLGPKRVNVTLQVASSSPDWAENDTRRWASALARKQDIGFRVYHGGEWLSLRAAKVRGNVKVAPNRADMRLTQIIFTAWSHDPIRYGEVASIDIAAVVAPSGGLRFPIVDGALDFGTSGSVSFPGGFAIKNEGTATAPIKKYTLRGPFTSFTITSETHVIEYDGTVTADQTLVLTPLAGGRAELDGVDVSTNLTQADWVGVPPGGQRGYLFVPVNATAATQLTVDYYTSAWE